EAALSGDGVEPGLPDRDRLFGDSNVLQFQSAHSPRRVLSPGRLYRDPKPETQSLWILEKAVFRLAAGDAGRDGRGPRCDQEREADLLAIWDLFLLFQRRPAVGHGRAARRVAGKRIPDVGHAPDLRDRADYRS